MAKLDIIISDLRRRISGTGFQPGDMIPTQKELAREMGVSVVTIGHAMRCLQQEGVIASIRGKGTIINALPKAQATLPIGIILTNSTLDDPVLKGPMQALQEACNSAGRKTEVFVVSRINRAQLRDWAQGLSGCVVFGTTKPELVSLIGSLGKPVVFHGEFYRGGCPPWASQITVSVEMMASICLQFLHSLGHRRMLLIRSRGTSYLESLGIHFEQQAKELECELEQLMVPMATDGHEVSEFLRESAMPPTAMIVDGGMRAGRIIHQLMLQGIRIPEEYSLLAINGVACEYLLTPELSRVEMNFRKLGERILGMMDAMIEAGTVMREEIMSSLVWGKTCRPLPTVFAAECPE